MNELSSYFARYPLENPANYLGTDFDPAGAAAYRLRLRGWKERYRTRMRAASAAAGPPLCSRRNTPSQPPAPSHCWYSFSRL